MRRLFVMVILLGGCAPESEQPKALDLGEMIDGALDDRGVPVDLGAADEGLPTDRSVPMDLGIDQGLPIDQGLIIDEGVPVDRGIPDHGSVDMGPVDQEICEPELCNGQDDDCDGNIDEDIDGQPCQLGVGECLRQGGILCVRGQRACNAPPEVRHPDVCGSGLDEDCDGVIDEAPQGACLQQIGTCELEADWVCEAGEWMCPPGDQQPIPPECVPVVCVDDPPTTLLVDDITGRIWVLPATDWALINGLGQVGDQQGVGISRALTAVATDNDALIMWDPGRTGGFCAQRINGFRYAVIREAESRLIQCGLKAKA